MNNFSYLLLYLYDSCICYDDLALVLDSGTKNSTRERGDGYVLAL